MRQAWRYDLPGSYFTFSDDPSDGRELRRHVEPFDNMEINCTGVLQK